MDSHEALQCLDQQTNRQYVYTVLNDSARAHLGDHHVHHHHYAAPTERAETPPSPSSTVPFRRDADFVDRGTILAEIERRCDERAGRVALVGIGGVGKSQLAIEYCHRLRERSPDTWVFWVYASSTARIEQGYREIAEAAKIPGRNDPRANIFELVKQWLQGEKKRKWLLVLDNVDHYVDLPLLQETDVSQDHQVFANPPNLKYQPRSLSDFLPQSQNGALLVTTRTTSVAHRLVEPRDTLHLEPMLEPEAVNLLVKKLNILTHNADLQKLAAVLEFMPLAIVQAAAYIQKRAPRCSVQQYVVEFNKSDQTRTRLLNHEAGHLRRDTEAKNSITITWQISFDYLREMRPSAADLLSLMSFFDRQGIPERLLRERRHERKDNVRAQLDENHEPATPDTDEFETDLDCLRDYSFVSVEADGSTLAMHRLVQLATRTWLVHHVQDAKYRSLFLSKLNAGFPTGAYENWTQCEALFPHAKAAEEQQPDRGEKDKSVRNWASILWKAAWYAEARGRYADAERMCSKSTTALEGCTDLDHIEISYSRAMLATVYDGQGRWTDAEQLKVQVVETFQRVLGPEHPDTLTSMGNLASTYTNQGRWNEAEELEVQVMETFNRVLGPEHPDTLTSMANLASTYRNQGQWKKAEELQAEEFEICKRVLGAEHPSTLTSMANLASIFWNQGRWKEAEELEEQVMETLKRLLGPEHPDTLASLGNLASTYRYQGRWKEAEELEVQVVDTRKRAFGVEHPSTLTSMANLASTYTNQGRWNEAEVLNVQVMETRKRVLGVEHPHTLSSMANLASTYRNQGQWDMAEELEVQVMEARQRLLGAEHPHTLTSMATLASTYTNQGRWNEAEELGRQVMETRKRLLGAEHPDTLASMGNLASTFWSQQRWKEAEELFMPVVETRKRVLGVEHPSTLNSMANLASTYGHQGRWKEAEELNVQVTETRKRVLGTEHPHTLSSMNNLAHTLKHRGQDDEAMELMTCCMKLCIKVLGPSHTLTQNVLMASLAWQLVERAQEGQGNNRMPGAWID